MADKTKSEAEKALLRDEMLGEIEQIAEGKRKRLSDFRDTRNFISSNRDIAETMGDD